MNLKQNILGKVKSVLIFHYFVLQQEKNFKDEKLIQGYLAHELDNWSNDLGNDFTVKTFWSETVKSTRKVPKEKFICNVYANSM